jgi:hypothetical protein
MTSGPPADGGPPRAQPPARHLQKTIQPWTADDRHSGPGIRADKTPPAASAARLAVKRTLTSRRSQRVTENDEYAAFARRVLRAWARRVAAGDIDAIADMAAAAREFDDAMRQAVTGLRRKGYSWAEIAARLGVTRQAAQQRWGGSRRDTSSGPANSSSARDPATERHRPRPGRSTEEHK